VTLVARWSWFRAPGWILRAVDAGLAKLELRRRLLAARAERSERSERSDATADAARASVLLRLAEQHRTSTVALYVGMPGEPATLATTAAIMDAGVRVLLPVVLPDRSLIFRVAEQVGPGGPLALGRGRLGLLVPPATAPVVPLGEAGLVVVPALALDRAGRRLGRGGGSYDRALVKLAEDAVAVGVVHPEELLKRVPEEPHDQRVTHVLAGAELQRARPRL